MDQLPLRATTAQTKVNHLDQEEERLDKEILQLQNELIQLKIDKRNILIAESIVRERERIDQNYSLKE